MKNKCNNQVAHMIVHHVVEVATNTPVNPVYFYFYAFGFSQLSTKYETTKPPAMRVVSNKVIQNNHHSFYNEGVQAIKIRKNGDYNG